MYILALFLVFKNWNDGAQTLLYCCVEPSLSEETGLYYTECRVKTPSLLARSQAEAEKLWQVSKDIVGDITPQPVNSTGFKNES